MPRSTSGSETDDFLSESSSGHMKDYRLEQDFYEDDILRGGNKDAIRELATGATETNDEEEKKDSPGVIKQMHEAFSTTTKYTAGTVTASSNTQRALDLMMDDLLEDAAAIDTAALPDERFAENAGKPAGPVQQSFQHSGAPGSNLFGHARAAPRSLVPAPVKLGVAHSSVEASGAQKVVFKKHTALNHPVSPIVPVGNHNQNPAADSTVKNSWDEPALHRSTEPATPNIISSLEQRPAQIISPFSTSKSQAIPSQNDRHSDPTHALATQSTLDASALDNVFPTDTGHQPLASITAGAPPLQLEHDFYSDSGAQTDDPFRGFKVFSDVHKPKEAPRAETSSERPSDTVQQVPVNAYDSYALTDEALPYELHKEQSIVSGSLRFFCYNVESLPRSDHIALLWGKVFTVATGARTEKNPLNPFDSVMQSALVTVSGLKWNLFVLPRVPVENLDTSKLSVEEADRILLNNIAIEKDTCYPNDHERCTDMFQESEIVNASYLNNVVSVVRAALHRVLGAHDQMHISITPVWRKYVFNDPALPRAPRVWLHVSYSAHLPVVPPKALESLPEVQCVLGHTIKPLEYWLATNRISGPSWLQVTGIDWARYFDRFKAVGAAYQRACKSGRMDLSELRSSARLGMFKDARDSVSTCFHEFSVDLNRDISAGGRSIVPRVSTLYLKPEIPEMPPLPLLSALCLSVRTVQDEAGKPPVGLSATLLFHAGYSLQAATFEPESATSCFVVFRRIRGYRPVRETKAVLPFADVSLAAEAPAPNFRLHVVPTDSEFEMWQTVATLVTRLNPDILLGHDLLMSVFAGLRRMSENVGIQALTAGVIAPLSRLLPGHVHISQQSFGRASAELSSWTVLANVKGRILLDVERMLREFSPDTKLSTLDYSCEALLGCELVLSLPQYLVDSFRETRLFLARVLPELARECLAVVALAGFLNAVPLTVRISQVTSLPWQQVVSAGRARRAEALLLHNFATLPFVLPDTRPADPAGAAPRREAKYVGGYVLDPRAGLYEDIIVVLDFNSLYPNIIREYNICFTTIRPPPLSGTPPGPPPGPGEQAPGQAPRRPPAPPARRARGQDPGPGLGDGDDGSDGSDGSAADDADAADALRVYYNVDAEIRESARSRFSGLLPRIIGRLVGQRLLVKKEIKALKADALRRAQPPDEHRLAVLDISQLALKICANAMYGSLGYALGRFYCPHVASAIPARGRSELMRAVALATERGYSVVYGDTDSIMVNTNRSYGSFLEDVLAAAHRRADAPLHDTRPTEAQVQQCHRAIAAACGAVAEGICAAVKAGRTYLELGLDYVFTKYLLLQKKKYAAVRLMDDGSLRLETKGLDLVRRDWAALSRRISEDCLNIIMFQEPQAVVGRIFSLLEAVRASVDSSSQRISLALFKMTKSLGKYVSQYDARNVDQMPHVRVALYLERTRNKMFKAGDIVEYVVLSSRGFERYRAQNAKYSADVFARGAGRQKAEAPGSAGTSTSTGTGTRASARAGASADAPDPDPGAAPGPAPAHIPLSHRCIPFDEYEQFFKYCSYSQILDVQWYIENQILPPLIRICQYVPEVTPARLAEAFGLDSKKYLQGAGIEPVEDAENGLAGTVSADLRRRFENCASYMYVCPQCGSVSFWPPPSYLPADTRQIPHPSFDKASDAVRGDSAGASGRSLLDVRDFMRMSSCSHDVNPVQAIACLERQLQWYACVHEAQFSTCSNSWCRCFVPLACVAELYPGATDSFGRLSDDAQRTLASASLNTLAGKQCRLARCNGSVQALLSAARLKTQLLFFHELFGLAPVLYGDLTGCTAADLLVFDCLGGVVQRYMDQNSYLNINICDQVASLFK